MAAVKSLLRELPVCHLLSFLPFLTDVFIRLDKRRLRPRCANITHLSRHFLFFYGHNTMVWGTKPKMDFFPPP